MRSNFREEQTFRIDHYLGKPAVQNLTALRFGNALFEPLWRRECIANIQITLAESIGVGSRGDFYSRTGALRDMIQNHALQLLTMVAMEPPSRNAADAIRDEKLKVLRSLKPFSSESAARDVVRGQYRAGSVEGRAGDRLSRRGQGAARQRHRDLRRLAHRGAELALGRECRSTCAPASAWPSAMRRSSSTSGRRRTTSFRASAGANKLVIKLQPEDGLELHLMAAKGAGQSEALAPVSLDLDFDKAFAENRVGAYERLLLDVIAGRLNLFVRSDEQEEAWRWVEPVLDTWSRDDTPPRPYTAGTWGPAAASALVARDGFAWSEEE